MAIMPMLYLYGFVPDGTTPPPDDLDGVQGRPVELLELDGFSAVVSRVPEDAYGENVLEEKLQDLDWVAERGVAHERVVTWFVDQADILPVRLLSLYSSRESLESEAAESRERVAGELERLSGLREWDLKVSYDAERLEPRMGEVSDEVRELDRQIEEASPGRRYLLEKKRGDRASAAMADAARRVGRELLDELLEMAVDSTTVPIPREAGSLPVVLNAALLVDREREEEVREGLRERAEELNELGLDVRFSGPWAPYRFVERSGREDVMEPEGRPA